MAGKRAQLPHGVAKEREAGQIDHRRGRKRERAVPFVALGCPCHPARHGVRQRAKDGLCVERGHVPRGRGVVGVGSYVSDEGSYRLSEDGDGGRASCGHDRIEETVRYVEP